MKSIKIAYSLKLLVVTLLASSSLFACSKKNDTPTPPSQQSESLVASDLKIELEIVAEKSISVKVIATKGTEPNIYRDGSLVSQGNYESSEEIISTTKTTITHKGKALVCGLIIDRTTEDESNDPIKITIKAKLWKNGKMVQEYNQDKLLQETILTEDFQLYGNSK